MSIARSSLKGSMTLMLFAMAATAWAKLEVPSVIGDHMVLQRGLPAVIWGTEDKGEKVTVSIQGKSGSAAADENGNWKVELPALTAGGPYELKIEGSNTLTFTDVLVGDVWVASGQSNMELAMNVTHDAAKTIPEATDTKIHLFLQARGHASKPLQETEGSWQVCSPETVKGFSAVAYHFAKNLRKKVDVPLGLIGSYWGGSLIECWIPDEELRSSPVFKTQLNRWGSKSQEEKDESAKGQDVVLELSGVKFIPKKDTSAKPLEVLMKPDANADATKTIGGIWGGNAAPGSGITFSPKEGGGPVAGPVGVIKGHFLAGSWGSSYVTFKNDGSPVDLSAYEAVEFYAKGHGKFMASFTQPSIIDYDIYGSQPFELTKKWEKHTILLSSLKQGGWGVLKPFTPQALSNLSFGVLTALRPEAPSVMYNCMIAPFTPLRIKGAIWYQGESNADRAAEYRDLLPGLIQGWRQVWREGDFPFLFVQLPNFMALQTDPNVHSDWAELREAQLMTLKVPKTGMPVIIDIGETNDIHPKNKTDVGYRLAQAALPIAYDLPGLVSPLYESMVVEGKKVRLRFKNLGDGLMVKGGGALKGFAIAGADGKFVWADAKIDGNSVVVWSDPVASPTAVRYAWADNPTCNLFGKNGMPVSPFRTDAPTSDKK